MGVIIAYLWCLSLLSSTVPNWPFAASHKVFSLSKNTHQLSRKCPIDRFLKAEKKDAFCKKGVRLNNESIRVSRKKTHWDESLGTLRSICRKLFYCLQMRRGRPVAAVPRRSSALLMTSQVDSWVDPRGVSHGSLFAISHLWHSSSLQTLDYAQIPAKWPSCSTWIFKSQGHMERDFCLSLTSPMTIKL